MNQGLVLNFYLKTYDIEKIRMRKKRYIMVIYVNWPIWNLYLASFEENNTEIIE